ncbi:MAG: hypothetical protein WAX89_03330 [Alphaproteobacteria bacterium]
MGKPASIGRRKNKKAAKRAIKILGRRYLRNTTADVVTLANQLAEAISTRFGITATPQCILDDWEDMRGRA